MIGSVDDYARGLLSLHQLKGTCHIQGMSVVSRSRLAFFGALVGLIIVSVFMGIVLHHENSVMSLVGRMDSRLTLMEAEISSHSHHDVATAQSGLLQANAMPLSKQISKYVLHTRPACNVEVPSSGASPPQQWQKAGLIPSVPEYHYPSRDKFSGSPVDDVELAVNEMEVKEAKPSSPSQPLTRHLVKSITANP